jgi:hypothetical protein
LLTKRFWNFYPVRKKRDKENVNTPEIHFWLCILILLAFLPTYSGVAASQPKAGLPIKSCTIQSAQAQCGSLRVYENRVAHSG